jgi:hypothetical protein
MVARAHDLIDQIEEGLVQIRTDLTAQEETLARTPEGPERLKAQARRADLEAQLKVAEDERRSYALAVTGFTVLSPDDRAIAILRQSALDEIRTLIEVEDLYRARATIRGALRNYEDGNLFELSPADHDLLLTQLAETERKIEDAERPPQPSAPGPAPADEGR